MYPETITNKRNPNYGFSSRSLKAQRKIVILNQAVNYLTIGLANAFKDHCDEVVLVTGSVHTQGEELDKDVKVEWINRWNEAPAGKKMISYLRALFNMWWLLVTRYRKYDVFFVSVPPMGYLLNLLVPHRFSMIIWDVYPDAFKITGMQESHWFYRLWSRLNRKSFKKAYRLFTISERMADLLAKYIKRDKIIVQPIWSIFQEDAKVAKNENPFVLEHQLQGKFVVQYSGNIGLTHKVEVLVELAEIMQGHKHILFQIIGRGPRKHILEKIVQSKGLHNTQFLPFQTDGMFPYSLSAADLGVVVLDEATSKGSVPSKSYNLMSYGIPSLYVASRDSELQAYADEFNHAKCFTSNELREAAGFIERLSTDGRLHQQYSGNALKAAENFKRANADKIVSAYFNLDMVPQETLI